MERRSCSSVPGSRAQSGEASATESHRVKMLIGRAEELQALERVIGADTPAAAIVLGESGTGKTRLLAEAIGRSRRATLLRVQGYETEEPIALAAAAALLRTLGVF